MGNKQIHQLDETSDIQAADFIVTDQQRNGKYQTAKTTIQSLSTCLKTMFGNFFVSKSAWKASTANAAGIVAATGGAANKIWATDASGNPSWKSIPGYGDWEPLINWDAPVSQIWLNNGAVTWKTNGSTYNMVYADGRCGRYVFPLKKSISDFNEITFMYMYDANNLAPTFYTFDVKMFEKAMNMKGIYNYLAFNPHMFFAPYTGMYLYSNADYSKSTPLRLLSSGAFYILEIYGRI